jgi:hypothetical protein
MQNKNCELAKLILGRPSKKKLKENLPWFPEILHWIVLELEIHYPTKN